MGLALAVIALSLEAPASLASFPGRNGPIALIQFESSRENVSSSSIELISSQGRRLRRVAACAAVSIACPSAPAFSPDGSRMAYDSGSFAPTGTRLVVANVDGTGRTTLPLLTESDTDPAWSPDGSRLVFTGRTSNGAGIDLFVVRANGTGLRRLTRGGGLEASWSSRDWIAYVRGATIRMVRPDGRRGRRLVRGAHPDWSPSGKTIAYDLRGRVYRFAVRSPGRRKARRGLVRSDTERPAWSPDGRKLVVLRPTGDVPSDLYVVRGDGRGLKRIYRTRAADDTSFNSVLEPAWGGRGAMPRRAAR